MPGVPRSCGHRRPSPQRRVLPRPLRRALSGAGAARDPRTPDDRAERARPRGGVGRQGLARALGPPRGARLRRRRPVPRPRHRRLLRRVGRATRARTRGAARRRRSTRSISRATSASRSRAPPRRRDAAPCGCVRAVEAAPVQLLRARARLRRRRDRPQPRRRGRGPPRQRAALGRRVPRSSAPGAARGAGLRAQGEAARPPRRARDGGVLRAARASTTRSRSARWPAGNRHLGYKEMLNDARGPLAGHQGRVPVRLPRARARALRRPTSSASATSSTRARRAARRHPATCARSAGCASEQRVSRSTSHAGAAERHGPARSSPATACCSSTPSGAGTSSRSRPAASSTRTPACSATTTSSGSPRA